jgi:hypothetical protein
MSVDTYNNLITEISDHLDRPDLVSKIPVFISLFETTANAELPLRTRFNLATTTLTTAASTATVALPADYLEAKALINQTDPREQVQAYGAGALYKQFPSGQSSRPRGFTTVGSTFELAPVPDAVYSLKLYYYQSLTPLASGTQTNWLLLNFGNLYLYGSLVAAEAYLGTDPRIDLWKGLYGDLITKLEAANERAQFGATPFVSRNDIAV